MSKKLVGGDFLLDLSSIELAESVDGETYTNITDKAILEQLTNLKNYVKNPQMIKPVWVKLINGETDELVVVRGSLAQVDDGEFDIVVNLDGYKLKIHVEFTQATLSDSTPIDDWYIDTNDAKYLLTSDVQALAEKLSDFTGDVNITGDVEIIGDFNAEKVTGDEIVENMSGYSGNVNIGTGKYFGIVKNGNKLTISLFGEIEKNTVSYNVATLYVPAEIYNKLVGGFTSSVYLDVKNVLAISSLLDTGANIRALMYKTDDSTHRIDINFYGLDTLDEDTTYVYRYEVTFLLSDNLILQP